MMRIPASETLKMFELASRLEQEGKRVYHFEVGQPDFPTPDNIVRAGIEALNQGFTKYVSARGITPLLDAIAGMYRKRGIEINGRKNVIVTAGAKMALFMGFLSTVDAGDDVLLLTPAWPSYKVMIDTVGATAIEVPTDASYTLDEEKLKERITKKTTCIVVNSPNNPTGGLLMKEDLKTIYDLATDHDFVIFSDEIYEALVYDGHRQTSMLEIDPAMERTLVINGFSKSYSMTGWRLGFAVGNPTTIDNMIRVQQNTTSCATSFVQAAGVEALKGDQSSVEKMRVEYEKRRNLMRSMLCEMGLTNCPLPLGAFYVFPDFSVFGIPSETLAERILEHTGVVCTPGRSFGVEYDGHLRFSYATSSETIKQGLAALSDYLHTLERKPMKEVKAIAVS
ncbi:MAG: pyridoxal phosphate-dependent aminotransferase [Candidatus Thorarchaeota archaeon]|nr:pyridoxal phosphate-dependent aminotransferase [Candidatus Thorarchaeota archaeon]